MKATAKHFDMEGAGEGETAPFPRAPIPNPKPHKQTRSFTQRNGHTHNSLQIFRKFNVEFHRFASRSKLAAEGRPTPREVNLGGF